MIYEKNRNKMNCLISIIVPVYNVEKYLPRCIESILSQSYPFWEALLVDDGSDDLSGMLCDKYAEQDKRIKVIHKDNGGLSTARNAALDIAQGDYICFLDSDDYIDVHFFSNVMCTFEKYDVEIVGIDFLVIDEDEHIIGNIVNKHGLYTGKKMLISELLLENINSYVCNKVFKRHVFENVRFPVGHQWEDLGTVYKLFLNADSICCADEKLYYYRRRRGSITHNINEKALQEIYLMQKRRYDDLLPIYPETAKLSEAKTVISALNLFDRSLWADVDAEVLRNATMFLENHRDQKLDWKNKLRLKLYYTNKSIYILLRIMKHFVGNIVKFLRIKLK